MSLLHKVAEMAGVSPSTVSRALNEVEGEVGEETRRRIQDAAESLGYRPRPSRRRKKSNDTNTITFLHIANYNEPLLSNPFFSRVLAGAQTEAASLGYQMVFRAIQRENAAGESSLTGDKPTDGILLVGNATTEIIERCRSESPAVVHVDALIEPLQVDSVISDGLHGALLAVNHLLDLGHERIGLLNAEFKAYSFRERRSGYRIALLDAGIVPDEADEICSGDERTLDGWLTRPNRPTAVFAVYDLLALSLIHIAYKLGLRVPEDLSVIGFDDIWFAEHATLPLTTIKIPKAGLGAMGVRLLVNRMRGYDAPPAITTLPATLVIRKTTSTPPTDRRNG